MTKVESSATEKTPSTTAEDAPVTPKPAEDQLQTARTPILDRSRAELRLPSDLVAETLRIAHLQRHQAKFNRLPEGADAADPMCIQRLEQHDVMQAGVLDPIAFELLDVVNMASLMIAVDLRFGSHSSVPTIWATPKLAVTSSSLDPNYVEFRGAEVGQLPQLLAQLVVLRSPQFVGQAPIAVNTNALVTAEKNRHIPDVALEALLEGGLDAEQAARVLAFQGDGVRRWKISSTWATDEGQQKVELRGLDAGPNGQWLLALTGSRDNSRQMNFTPQGHGEVMRALRLILPKHWVGKPLNQPAV